MTRFIILIALAFLCLGQTCLAAITTAEVQVVSFPGPYSFVPLAVGTPLSTTYPGEWWYEFPDVLNEQPFHIWQGEIGQGAVERGIISFQVVTDGPVLMAVSSRWGGGGGSWGDWIPELTTREELEAQGWSLFAEPMLFWSDRPVGVNDIYFSVFRRDSLAGEAFTYRTEKYIPPHLITTQYVEPIPEPSTLAIWSLLATFGIAVGRRRRQSL